MAGQKYLRTGFVTSYLKSRLDVVVEMGLSVVLRTEGEME